MTSVPATVMTVRDKFGADKEVDRELRSHLELESEEQQTGLLPKEAHYVALRAFGNTTLVKEATQTPPEA